MSYDIDIADEWFNYTFNLSGLFYAHIPDGGKGGGIRELAGLTGRQAVSLLAEALSSIDRERSSAGEAEFRKRYDAGNGWGNVPGAVSFLTSILCACVRHPRSKIGYSDLSVENTKPCATPISD